jgi:acyl-CoA synthetase (AMP-forming)/AMP-acid ligase II
MHDQQAQHTLSLAQTAAQMTVGGMLRLQMQREGNRPALQHGSRIWSYGELNERANRLANALALSGIRHGDRIAVLSENRPEYIEIDLAAAKLGAIVACLNWRMTDAELTHCIKLVQPSLGFVSPRFDGALRRLDHGIPRVIGIDAEYGHLLAQGRSDEPPAQAQPEDGFIILYTSGTTGLSKGALISQRAMIARCIIGQLDRPAGRDDGFIAWSPLFHMGATDNLFATFARGGKVIVQDGFNAGAIAATIEREAIGHLTILPGVVDKMIAELNATGIRPKGLRTCGVMADLVPLQQLAELTTLLKAPYLNSFGSTETGATPASAGLIPVGEVPKRLSKSQSSLCQVRLVDADDREVPDGEPGEIAVRTPALFSGYWNAPETNARDFRNGWFHMGDVFVRNPDRTLDFVDRNKYLIKSGGENIYPAEIERLLLASPRVAEAIVVRRSDARWGEVPVAFVVPKDDSLTGGDVIEMCRGKIANYKLPKEVRFITQGQLPRNSSGKIERREVEALLSTPDARAATRTGN